MVQATFAATLFDEWVSLGLRDVVVCPGSRSTPLALACARRRELRVHVRIDERSAGFFAIGRALVSDRPVAVVVTSGTAAAELHACVAEASHALVPLIIVTADRPPELHGVGAPQTIDQHHLYGGLVRRFEDPGVALSVDVGGWRAMALGLWNAATTPRSARGPVHLNAAFVEPLVGEPLALSPREGADERTTVEPPDVVAAEGQRVLCVVGNGVSSALIAQLTQRNWVVVGDATAAGTTSYVDAMLRSDRFATAMRPDVVVRVGGSPA